MTLFTGLTEEAVDDAIQANGADKAVGFPHTAYCLPCYYAVTGVKIKTLGELEGSSWCSKIPDDTGKRPWTML